MKSRKLRNRIADTAIVSLFLGASIAFTLVTGERVLSETQVEDLKPIEPITVKVVDTAEKLEAVTLSVETQEIETVPPVDPEDLEILAHLLVGEAGSDWCSDKMIYYVGSVVLNRLAADDFPDTIEGVVFEKGQYACTWDGNYYREPSERHYRIAEDLLRNGSLLPVDVVFQAQFEQGSKTYAKVQNMYFCYRYYYEG